MNQDNKVVALFTDHAQAEAAIRSLQTSGFDMRKLSIVGRDYSTEEQVLGYVTAGDRVRFWGKFGAMWGGLWGLLLGSAMLLFPGVGHVIVLGPLAGALINMAGGAAIGGGVGVLGGALASIGIPDDAVLKYQNAIHAGQFAVIAHGSADEVGHARELLQSHAPQVIDEHLPNLQPV